MTADQDPSSPKAGPRKWRAVSESLERRLGSYALAASAAGVVLLATTQPAKANSIVVQNLNETLIGPGSLSFTLGSDTFSLVNTRILSGCSGSACRYISNMNMYPRDALLAIPTGRDMGAYPLSGGAYIGPGVPGSKLGPVGGSFLASAQWSNHASHATRYGWGGLNFVGLRFDLHGQPHYGWLEILTGALEQNPPLESALVAYGYNRQPNAGILAGQTSNHSVPEPSTLALLALGSAALPLWRRKKDQNHD